MFGMKKLELCGYSRVKKVWYV